MTNDEYKEQVREAINASESKDELEWKIRDLGINSFTADVLKGDMSIMASVLFRHPETGDVLQVNN